MSYAFSAALTASESRLRQQLKCQSLMCKCHLSLAGRSDQSQLAAAQQHLAQAL